MARQDNLRCKAVAGRNLRILHKELGKQISEMEDDPEDAAAALQGIHADIKAQLDALDNVLENNRQSAKNEK